MKIIAIIVVVLMAGVIFFSCKTKKKATEATMNSLVGKSIVKFSKGSCRGNCKQFDLSINEDKTLNYKGIRNVDNIGDFSATISQEDYDSLISLFKKNDFSKLNSEYLSGARDLQRIDITFNSHSVAFHNRLATKELSEVMEALEALIAKVDWKK